MFMENLVLKYNKPPDKWIEGLPIGNGRLGAMICGSPLNERLALNHEWLYKGLYRDRKIIPPPESALQEVRALIKRGNYEEATKKANEYFAPTGGTLATQSRQRVDPFQPAGDLYIAERIEESDIGNYERSLNLSTASAWIRFEANGCLFTRKIFAFYPAGEIALELNTIGREQDFEISLHRIFDSDCQILYSSRSTGGNTTDITMEGVFKTGVIFTVSARVLTKGHVTAKADRVSIKGGNSTLLLVDIDTNTNENKIKKEASLSAYPHSFESMSYKHEKNWKAVFECCGFELKSDCATEDTENRLEKFKKGEDNSLPALYFNYGRYLMLSSAGDLPPNLQGIWNEKLDPPWDADFHTDINLQMNYWLAEPSGMVLQIDALLRFVERLIPSAKIAAQELYGCRGVWYPIQTDAWSISTPEAHGWAVWVGAAAWLALHFWQRYLYSLDKQFLRTRAYPFFKLCAEFFEDYLIDDGQHVLILPSQSPENAFEGGGVPVSICYNCASDIELCALALTIASESADILGVDSERSALWKSLKTRLPELKIGPKGEIMEFPEAFIETEPGHRHLSHLLAIYPAKMIKENTDKLFKAAKRSLDIRMEHGGGQSGWSRAWASCLYATFRNSAKAYASLKTLICDYSTITLLDLHPPGIFQIDGNFGGAATIFEMLLQQRFDGVFVLLPALPKEWASGKIWGVHAPGRFILNFEWKDMTVVKIEVYSDLKKKCRISAENLCDALTNQCKNGYLEVSTLNNNHFKDNNIL